MKNFFKNKVVTALVVFATVILAGVAIFTAVRLYQLRTSPVAPTAPESEPAASQPQACRELAFTITTPTPTESTTPTPTDTTTPTPTTYITTTPTPTGSTTPTPTDSTTPTPTTTGTPTVTPTTSETVTLTPTGDPELPAAGVESPTIFAGAVGILLIVLSLILAL